MSNEIRFSSRYVAAAGISRGRAILCSPAAGSWSAKTMFVTEPQERAAPPVSCDPAVATQSHRTHRPPGLPRRPFSSFGHLPFRPVPKPTPSPVPRLQPAPSKGAGECSPSRSPTSETRPWRADARCRDGAARLIDLFYSEALEDIAEAKEFLPGLPGARRVAWPARWSAHEPLRRVGRPSSSSRGRSSPRSAAGEGPARW